MADSDADDSPGLPQPAQPAVSRTFRLPYHPSSSSALSSARSVSPVRPTPSPVRQSSRRTPSHLATSWRRPPAPEEEEEYEADLDEVVEIEATVPDDIVQETSTHWANLRNRARRSREGNTDLYNLDTFITKWVEDPRRARQLASAILKPHVQEALRGKGAIVKTAEEDQEGIVLKIRRELKPLQRDPSFSEFKPEDQQAAKPTTVEDICKTAWLDTNLTGAWPTLKQKAPITVKLLSQVMQSQWEKDDTVLEGGVDPRLRSQIYLLVSIFLGGIARNKASFLRDILGLYLVANGTSRRAIETLNHIGVIPSYWTLNRMLNDMAQHAKDGIKKVSRDPNSVVVYDNFNFKNRVRELAGGKQDQFINLTTALLVACPELNGPFKQSDIDMTVQFTRKMVIDYLLPRRPVVNATSRWLVKHAFRKLFKRDIEPMPIVKRVTFPRSPYIQLGAIFEDEGTIDGVYRLHETLFKDRLDMKDCPDRLILVHGDQKTTSFIRRIKNSQLESVDTWEQKKWIIPVPAFFHIELNYIEMLFRIFWDTGAKTTSPATISADVQFFHRGKNISKKDIKYHQVLPLLMHGFTARVLAFILQDLMEGDILQGPLSVNSIINAFECMNDDDFGGVFDRV